MKKITLVFALLFLSFHGYSQFSFTSWNVESVNPGGTINFEVGQIKNLSIVFNLQKPNNLVVGNSRVYLLLLNSSGSEVVEKIHIKDISSGDWCCGTGAAPTYTSASVSLNGFLIPGSSFANFRAHLLFVAESGSEMRTSNFINFIALLPPIANAGADKCTGPNTVIGGSPAATSGTPPYTYSWSPSTGLSSTTVPNPTVNPTATTTYTLTVTDSKGLKDTDVVVVSFTNQSIIGFGKFVLSCNPAGYTSNRYDISTPIPAGALSYTWSTSYGEITGFYFTGSLKTGVTVSIGNNLPVLPIAIRDSFNHDLTTASTGPVPSSFTITCIAQYTCGATTYTKQVNTFTPICPAQSALGDEQSNDSLDKPEELEVSVTRESDYQFYPNPSNGYFKVKFKNFTYGETIKVTVLDNFGRHYMQKTIAINQDGEVKIDIQSGSYLVKINKDQKEITNRIVVK